MRGSRGVFAAFVVLAFASLPLFAGAPIDEMITSLNVMLADHSFTDHSGQQAQTSIAIEDGVLVVQTAKHKGADVFTNIWRAPVSELDADDIRIKRVPVLPAARRGCAVRVEPGNRFGDTRQDVRLDLRRAVTTQGCELTRLGSTSRRPAPSRGRPFLGCGATRRARRRLDACVRPVAGTESSIRQPLIVP